MKSPVVEVRLPRGAVNPESLHDNATVLQIDSVFDPHSGVSRMLVEWPIMISCDEDLVPVR